MRNKEPVVCREAKACPFCGQKPTIQPWHGGAPTKRMIACPNLDCDVSPNVTGETRQQAVERWNKRAPVTQWITVAL